MEEKKKQLSNALKDQAATNTQQKMRQVYNQVLGQFDFSGLNPSERSQVVQHPEYHLPKMHRARKKAVPPVPHIVTAEQIDIHLSEEYTEITLGNTTHQFVIANEIFHHRKLLIFGVHENLIYLHQTNPFDPTGQTVSQPAKVFADGNYHCAPGMFSQLYTIHAYIGKKLFPIIFAFLPEKTRAVYERMLTLIKNQIAATFIFESGQGVVWQPLTFEIDFERAMISAVTNVLSCPVKGCLFHFRQAIIRRADSYRLDKYYNITSHPINKLVRMVLALPFVPQHLVVQAFGLIEAIANTIENPNPPDPGTLSPTIITGLFLNYVESTWIGTATEAPLFQTSMWNWYNIFQDRTNNRVEGYFRDLNEEVGSQQPQFFELLNILITRTKADLLISSSYIHGTTPVNRIRRSDRDKNNRIRNAIDKFEDQNQTHYNLAEYINDLITLVH